MANTLQYVINYTDPLNNPFVVNPYTSNGPTSPISMILDPSATNDNTSLLFYGKGHPNYGERTEENFVHLLESFSGGTAPVSPISGQLWYTRYDILQTATGTWSLWSDSQGLWTNITSQVTSITGPPSAPPSPNQYQLDTVTGTLYFGVVIPGHPLNGQWIERVYSTDVSIGSPAGTSTPMPQKVLRVFTGDTREWDAVNDVIVSPVQPTSPDVGALWFDTSSSTLQVCVSISPVVFDPLLTTGGIVPVVNGGTGASTAAGAINNLLPSQTGNNGKILTTDGSNVSWQTNGGVGTGTVTSVAVAAGTAALTVIGSPITTNGTITITLADPELLALSELTTTGIVRRTGVATYTATTLTSSDIIAALGYTPVNTLGDIMFGSLTFSTGEVRGLPLDLDPSDVTAATSKTYVDNRDIVAATFAGDVLTLTRGNGSTIVTVEGTFDQPYTPLGNELLANLTAAPTTANDAIHDLDNVVRRRTKATRFVQAGVTGQTTYNVPQYVVGSSKLQLFVDGVKWISSTLGYQRVLFTLPSSINQLDCSTQTLLDVTGSTTYTFSISVDLDTPVVVTLTGAATAGIGSFCGLVNELNTYFGANSIGATAALEDDNGITVYSNTHGAGSSINMTAGGTDLFTSAQFFNKYGTAADGIPADLDQTGGASYGYDEVGNYGALASTIVIDPVNPDLPTNSNFIEAIVIGGTGTTYFD